MRGVAVGEVSEAGVVVAEGVGVAAGEVWSAEGVAVSDAWVAVGLDGAPCSGSS
jgi:hypothetical protein